MRWVRQREVQRWGGVRGRAEGGSGELSRSCEAEVANAREASSVASRIPKFGGQAGICRTAPLRLGRVLRVTVSAELDVFHSCMSSPTRFSLPCDVLLTQVRRLRHDEVASC